MKRWFLVGIRAVLCIVLLAWPGLARGEQSGLPQTAQRQGDVVGPAQYQSQQGYTFAVPQGYMARPIESKVYIVDARYPAGPAEFVIQTCPGPEPDSCLGDPQMPARLVKVENTVLAGQPATEYTYWRRNKEQAWTREWAEVHTLVTAKGKTFDVVAMIPPYAPPQHWEIYDQIRQSFRLTSP